MGGTKLLETVVVRSLQQQVVGIDELEVLACGHLYARVAGPAESLVLLAYVDDVVAVVHELFYRTIFGAVIHNDNLPLCRVK